MSALHTELDPAVHGYVSRSYPHNHDYRVIGGRLRPRWKLWWRARRIRRLYPDGPTSLLDLSSSKGYFVLCAAADGCERVLGIDVHERDLAASRAVRDHLGLERARFEQLRLDELVRRIDDFGGPFQTVLLINTYPYLYFGSERSEQSYPDHDVLFDMLRTVCTERVVFSNRTELARCPRHIRACAAERGLGADFSETRILAAARARFEVTAHGHLVRGVPLWLLHTR